MTRVLYRAGRLDRQNRISLQRGWMQLLFRCNETAKIV